MKHSRNSTYGFTIVELVIAVIVISILAALVLTSVSSMQAKARDTERQTDMLTIAKSLEAYYSDKGVYPANNQMTNFTWVRAQLKDIPDEKTYVSPLSPDGTQSSLVSRGLPAITNTDDRTYHYRGLNTYTNNGSQLVTNNGCASNDGCNSYVLAWRRESDGELQYIFSSN